MPLTDKKTPKVSRNKQPALICRMANHNERSRSSQRSTHNESSFSALSHTNKASHTQHEFINRAPTRQSCVASMHVLNHTTASAFSHTCNPSRALLLPLHTHQSHASHPHHTFASSQAPPHATFEGRRPMYIGGPQRSALTAHSGAAASATSSSGWKLSVSGGSSPAAPRFLSICTKSLTIAVILM